MTECPICHRPVREPPADGPRGDYPFCTARCKLVDLGRWLKGSYQIPVQITPDEIDDAGPDRDGGQTGR